MRGPGDDPAHQIQPIQAARERDVRLVVADVGIEPGEVTVGDVGRISHDEIERRDPWHRVEEIAVRKRQVAVGAEAVRVVLGHHERAGGEIRRRETKRRSLLRQRDGDTPRAGAEVEGVVSAARERAAVR